MAPSSPGSRPRPPGGLRPALTPTPGDAHRQRRGAGSNKPRSPRFQGIATGLSGRELWGGGCRYAGVVVCRTSLSGVFHELVLVAPMFGWVVRTWLGLV